MSDECLASPRPMWRDPEFARGSRDMVGVSLGIAAWGLVTGVAMAKSGMPLPLSIVMSLLVFAGSAQLAALPLIVSGAPIWMVWAIALCVNLRFVIFSAQWRPYFAHLPRWQRMWHGYFTADLNYVVFMSRFPDPKPSPEQRHTSGAALRPTGRRGSCRRSPACCSPTRSRPNGASALPASSRFSG